MSAARIVDVAVGVLIRDDGDFLLAQRPAGKPYAGYWEFPGGKLEPGESVAQALHRELHEELGLDIGTVCPWVVREHVYPHAHVRLHFCRVFDWCGDAHGREGQAFGFFSLHRLPEGPLLEGALPVMPWLGLPEQCRLQLEGAAAGAAAAPAARPAVEPAAGPAVTAAKPDVLVLRPASRLGASAAWWVEFGAAAPRRGCQVGNRAEAEAAVAAAADFLVVADRDAGPVLEVSAIPVFVIAAPQTTLSSLRARGAHGRAVAVPS